jgi:hypothetical protein
MAIVEIVTLSVHMVVRVPVIVPRAVSVLVGVIMCVRMHRAVGVPMLVGMGMGMGVLMAVFGTVVMRMDVAVHGAIGMAVFVRMTSRGLSFHPSLAFSATADRAHLSSPRIAELN